MAITLDPTFIVPPPINQMTPEEKRMAEIERLVAEQVEQQRGKEVGRQTFARIPGATPDPLVKPEQFNITQDMLGNYWNRIQRFAGGPLMIERLKSEYTPADQRKVEKLYRDRSAWATDPEAGPEEREAAFDMIDAQISRVPKMPPIMREPTAQQKFDASIVTAPDGMKGTFEPKTGKFLPLESSKAREKEDEEHRKRLGIHIATLVKANEDPDNKNPRDYKQLLDQAKWMADAEFGRVKLRTDAIKPELDTLWQAKMSKLDEIGLFKNKRASNEQMIEVMRSYVQNAMAFKGVTESEAKYDFTQRWIDALGGGQYNDLVPKMSADMKRKARFVAASTVVENDPDLAGVRDQAVGVTKPAGQPEVPSGLESIWPTLDDDDKAAIQQKLSEGWTATEILTALGRA